MTKGLVGSRTYTTDENRPNDPRDQLYPYAYVMADMNQPGKFIVLTTGSSTLLNNATRQIPGDKWEGGRKVIDYSFNIDQYDDENIIEQILGRKMNKQETAALEARKAEKAKKARSRDKMLA
jgi:hypothetical protein